MECKECGAEMGIEIWSGWRWTCYQCDTEGREATEDEIVKQENEYCKREERRCKDVRK